MVETLKEEYCRDAIYFKTPWPPSINSMYANRSKSMPISYNGVIPAQNKKRGRILSKEAIQYKKYVKELIGYKFSKIKYGNQDMEVTILSSRPDDNYRRDNHNNTKCLFDAIEESGVIDNDSQIVRTMIIPLPPFESGYWLVLLNQYDSSTDEKLINLYKKIFDLKE